jgi:Transposase DDE domain
MDARESRGLELAARFNIRKQKNGSWKVPSAAGNGIKYTVVIHGKAQSCSCPDHCEGGHKCKHIFAAEIVYQREFEFYENGEVRGIETAVVRTVRTSYPQNWQAYNAAQTTEKSQVQILLHDLCNQIPEPLHFGPGRPRLPLGDAIFAACFKVYSTVSGRRFMCDLADAQAKGYIGRVPHFNAVFKVLESPATSPILESLIKTSATPLRALETGFACDSSGFSSSRFDRWFEHKWGEVQIKRAWVKAHVMTGVKTNVITACEISNAGDAPTLPKLLNDTAERFNISEVCADLGYSSRNNLEVIDAIGATPLIPFKSNATPAPERQGSLWAKMYHYFALNREKFMGRYHQRSNVESTFSMVKAKFGDSVRSKTDTAMKNEVLAKFLCHNLCCLVQSMHEFNITPNFSAGSLSAPKWSLN